MSNVKVKAPKKPVKPVIVVIYILLVILAVIYLAPLLWMLSVSLQSEKEITTIPLTLLPKLTRKKMRTKQKMKIHFLNRLSFFPMRKPKPFQNTLRIFSFWQGARISRCCVNLRTGCDFENVLFIAR